jgi:hypothetical protein
VNLIKSVTVGSTLIRLYQVTEDQGEPVEKWGVAVTALRGRHVDQWVDAAEFDTEGEAREYANGVWKTLRNPSI